MDNEQLKNIADTKFELAVAKKNILERIESQLLVPYNGGMFKATMGLQSFLASWPDMEQDIVIPDEYENPISIIVGDLLRNLRMAYQYAMNEYLDEYTKLRKVRKGSQL